MSVREIIVRITGDAKGAQRASREAESALAKFGVVGEKANIGLSRVTSTLANFGTVGRGAGAGLSKLVTSLGEASPLALAAGAGVVALGVGLVELGKTGVNAYVHLTDEVRQFQRVSGASAEESSRWVFAMKELGVDADLAGRGIFLLSKNIEQNAANLQAHGIIVSQNVDPQKRLTETLTNVGRAYAAAETQTKKNVIANVAFGRSGRALLPVLEDVIRFQKLQAEAGSHGLVFSQSDIDKTLDYKLAVQDVGEAWKGVQVKVGRALLPIVTRAATDLGHLIDLINKPPPQSGGGFWGAFARDSKSLTDAIFGSKSATSGASSASDALGNSHKSAALAALQQADAEKVLAEVLVNQDPLYGAVKGVVLGLRNAERDYAASQHDVQSASERVGAARRGLNDLLRKGAVDTKAVAAAEREVRSSAQGVTDAEDQLADAIKRRDEIAQGASARDKQRADIGLRGSILAIAGAHQSEADAVDALNKARTKGDPKAIAAANLDLERASLAVESANLDNADAQDKLNEANGIGEEYAKKLADANKSVEQASRDVANATDQHKLALDRLHEAEVGDVNFSQQVIDAKRAIRDAEYDLAGAKQGVIDKAATLQEAQDAENRLLGVGGDAALLLRIELEKLVQLYPTLKPMLDRLNATLVKDQYGYTGAGPPAPGYGGRGPSGDGHVGSGFAALIADMQGSGIPFHVSSTTSGNHVKGSLHYQGKAVDFTGPDMMRIAQYFLQYQDELQELFYTPLGFSVKNGRRVTPPIAASGHYDHVHVGTYDRGGILPPGLTLALNKTGRNEYIADPHSPMGVTEIHLHVGTLVGSDGMRELAQIMTSEQQNHLRRNGRSTVTTTR